jgi:hypothetical protein
VNIFSKAQVEEGSVDILSNNLPAELRNFLLVRGGHSLIIRGNAGTGKTTLALQLIEELAEIEDSYYFSTRVSDAVLLNQFPWLSGHLYGNGAEEAIAMETELYEEEQILAALPPMPAELMDGESQRLWLNKLKLRGAFDFDVRPGQSFPQNRIDLTEMERCTRLSSGPRAENRWWSSIPLTPWPRPVGSTPPRS